MESNNPKNRFERGASAMLGRTDPGTNEQQARMSEQPDINIREVKPDTTVRRP